MVCCCNTCSANAFAGTNVYENVAKFNSILQSMHNLNTNFLEYSMMLKVLAAIGASSVCAFLVSHSLARLKLEVFFVCLLISMQKEMQPNGDFVYFCKYNTYT